MNDGIVWEYLEELPEQTAAWCERQNHLGQWEKFSVFYRNYLKPEMVRAQSVECFTPCKYNCPREVIEEAYDDIKAVCPRHKIGPYRLKFSDTILHSLNHSSFHRALRGALKLKPCPGDKRIFDNTWCLGEYSFKNDNNVEYPVCLTIPANSKEMTDVVEHLCDLHREPFVLLAPTRYKLSTDAARRLNVHKSVFLTLKDAFTLQDDGSLSLNEESRIAIHENIENSSS